MAVSLLALEFHKSKQEKEEEEEAKEADKEMLRSKLYSLEVAIARQDENILTLANTLLQKSSSLGSESSNVSQLRETISSSSSSKDAIKPLELSSSTESRNKAQNKDALKNTEKSTEVAEEEEKSLTDEFVDFMEEVTEEILEVLIPDDD